MNLKSNKYKIILPIIFIIAMIILWITSAKKVDAGISGTTSYTSSGTYSTSPKLPTFSGYRGPVYCINADTMDFIELYGGTKKYTVTKVTEGMHYSANKTMTKRQIVMLQYIIGYGVSNTTDVSSTSRSIAKQIACWYTGNPYYNISTQKMNDSSCANDPSYAIGLYATKYGGSSASSLKKEALTIYNNAYNYYDAMELNYSTKEKIPEISSNKATVVSYGTNTYKVGPFTLNYLSESLKTINRIEVINSSGTVLTQDTKPFLLANGTTTSSIPNSGQQFFIIVKNVTGSKLTVRLYHNYESYATISLYKLQPEGDKYESQGYYIYQSLLIAEGKPNKGTGYKEVTVSFSLTPDPDPDPTPTPTPDPDPDPTPTPTPDPDPDPEPEPEPSSSSYSVKIVKRDSSSNSTLSGAVFSVNGTRLSATNSRGIATSNSITVSSTGTDTVTISEVTAPSGYKKLSGSIVLSVTKSLVNNTYKATRAKISTNQNGSSVSFNSSTNTITVTIYNEVEILSSTYKIKIVKQDSVNSNKLSGAVFSVNGTRLSATNSRGIATSNSITVSSTGTDTVTISEVTAPSGYKKLSGNIVLKVTKQIVSNTYKATSVSISTNQNGSTATFDSSTSTITVTIKDEIEKIKLSGYVWEDVRNGKDGILNGQKDSNENQISGVKVYLHTVGNSVYSTDPSVWSTTTNSNGYYEFEVPKGVSYWIEFKYNGYNYQHTKYTKYTGASSPVTSNATETEKDRDELNNRLSLIEPNTNINGIKVSNKDNSLGASDLGTNEIYAISAYVGGYGKTDSTEFNNDQSNINLGLTRRETVDLALRKDVYSAKFSINGSTQEYLYNRNDKETDSNGNSYWDIGVRQNDGAYYQDYSREIKAADYNSIDIVDEDKALSVEVTYVILVRNQSGYLDCNLTELVDYYDKAYTFKEAHTSSRESIIASTTSSYSHNTNIANYNKMYFKLNKDLQASGNDLIIYVTYTVNTDSIGKLELDNDDGKGNMVEIMGYKTTYGTEAISPNANNTGNTYIEYKSGDVAGRIDEDSNPGNATSTDKSKFEDDTDRAPYIKFKLDESEKTMSGYVWEDFRTEQVDKAVVGNGIRENTETLIDGIKVQLWHKDTDSIAKVYNGTEWVNAETITSNGGQYIFRGFIPGNYYVKFIYGEGENSTYNGQDYKSTTYHYDKVCQDFDINNPDNLGIYNETTENYSDARDLWTRREEINNLLNDMQTNGVLEDYMHKDISMQAVTGLIKVNIEKDPSDTDSSESREYILPNIDLGLQQRPKAQLMINKKVTNVKVVLANGNTLFDASGRITNVLWKDKQENIHGYTDGLMDIPSIRSNAQTIQLTMDEELMHGATITVLYGITVQNIGEVDYASKLFYYKSERDGSEEVVKTTIGQIVDYPGAAGTIDPNTTVNNLQFLSTGNNGWSVTTASNLIGNKLVKILDSGSDKTSEILNDYKVILTYDISKELVPAIENEANSKTDEITLTLSQVMTSDSSKDQLAYNNMVEILSVKNPLGRKMQYSTVGNQNPNDGIAEIDSDMSQSVTILPPFGQDYIYYVLGTVVAIITVAGIILIKVKVLKPKK